MHLRCLFAPEKHRRSQDFRTGVGGGALIRDEMGKFPKFHRSHGNGNR